MTSEPSSELRLLESALGKHLFVVDGSRLYDLDPEMPTDADTLREMLSEIAPAHARCIDGTPLAAPALQTLSLNVAQACNMGCGYCYADGGAFKGRSRLMPSHVGRAAVDRLIAESRPGADLVVGFMGGEPFLNRPLIHDVVAYAAEQAPRAGRSVRFSVTTNGTLMDERDVVLMAEHPFQVSISLDGPALVHDRQRSLLAGGSSHARVLQTLVLFARLGRPKHLSARATVTPLSNDLPTNLRHLLDLGFDSAGFAPVLSSPDPRLAFEPEQLTGLLDGMLQCARTAQREILARRRYSFSNFEIALQELDRGTHRPYPCGAGAAYLSVNAEGQLYACHRLIDDPKYHFGDVKSGSDVQRRSLHLVDSHVDRQLPCRSCWARYLCGGGCYHEVSKRGRVACDYIRAWLEHCIVAYAEMKELAPEYFSAPESYFAVARRTATEIEP